MIVFTNNLYTNLQLTFPTSISDIFHQRIRKTLRQMSIIMSISYDTKLINLTNQFTKLTDHLIKSH